MAYAPSAPPLPSGTGAGAGMLPTDFLIETFMKVDANYLDAWCDVNKQFRDVAEDPKNFANWLEIHYGKYRLIPFFVKRRGIPFLADIVLHQQMNKPEEWLEVPDWLTWVHPFVARSVLLASNVDYNNLFKTVYEKLPNVKPLEVYSYVVKQRKALPW